MPKTILLIGARGFLGSQVLQAILDSESSYTMQALIRQGSDAAKIEEMGVQVVRGDMMDATTLETAMQGVHVVINTANGYMQGNPKVDTEGANNVADAVKKCNVGRYIYCSVLTADKAVTVQHFLDKSIHEEYCKSIGIPFIALRPGAFIDQSTDYLGDAIKAGNTWALCPWDQTVPIGMIYTPDLARFFALAIDLPAEADNQSIDVGWSHPVSYIQVVDIVSEKLGRKMKAYAVPWFLRMVLIYTYGWFDSHTCELLHMFNYFGTKQYVNNVAVQEKFFGSAPSPEEVIGRYVDSVMAQSNAA